MMSLGHAGATPVRHAARTPTRLPARRDTTVTRTQHHITLGNGNAAPSPAPHAMQHTHET